MIDCVAQPDSAGVHVCPRNPLAILAMMRSSIWNTTSTAYPTKNASAAKDNVTPSSAIGYPFVQITPRRPPSIIPSRTRNVACAPSPEDSVAVRILRSMLR